jgi:hypothetical protein
LKGRGVVDLPAVKPQFRASGPFGEPRRLLGRRVMLLDTDQIKVRPGDLIVLKGKPPTEANEAFADLKRLLAKVGCLQTPVFVDAQWYIVEGFYRFWAASALGWRLLPVVVVKNTQEALAWVLANPPLAKGA